MLFWPHHPKLEPNQPPIGEWNPGRTGGFHASLSASLSLSFLVQKMGFELRGT